MARRPFAAARAVHAWAGAVVAGVLFVLSVSGTLLVLKDDYLRLTVPEARQARALDAEALGAVVDAAEARWGDGLRAVVFAEPGFGLHRAYLADGGAYLGEGGAVVAAWNGHGRFEVWLTALHHDLTAGKAGRAVAGIAGVAAVLLCVSGLVAYWPMRRGLRRGLRADGLERRELRSLHRNMGLVAALPTLLLAVTGASMTFPGPAKALLGGGGEPPVRKAALPAPADGWSAVIGAADAAFFDGAARVAFRAPDGAMTIRVRQAPEWHPNGRSVAQSGPDAASLRTIDAEALPAGERAFNALYPLHAAHVGGRVADGLAIMAGTALSMLTGVGLLSFLRRAPGLGGVWRSWRPVVAPAR